MVNHPYRTGELEASYYARDNTQIFYSGKLIYEADPQSFEAISINRGKDKNMYFIDNTPLPKYLYEKICDSDEFTPESIEVLTHKASTYLLRCNSHYYYVKFDREPWSIEETTSSDADKYLRSL